MPDKYVLQDPNNFVIALQNKFNKLKEFVTDNKTGKVDYKKISELEKWNTFLEKYSET